MNNKMKRDRVQHLKREIQLQFIVHGCNTEYSYGLIY